VDTLWRIIATLGLVFLNGYFVAVEFASVSARVSRLEQDAERSLISRLALEVRKKLDLYLSSCQLGITLASLALGHVMEPAFATLLDPVLRTLNLPTEPLTLIIAISAATSLHIVIGEQAPKNWSIQFADKVLPLLAPPLIVFTYLFYPAIWLLNFVTNRVLRLVGVKINLDAHGGLPHTEDELKSLLSQSVAHGTISKGHERILTQAFEFGDLKVRQIMTPRTEVAFLKLHQPMTEMLKTIRVSQFTRLPLCDGDLDHVVGLIHMKDLFNHLKLVPGKLRFSDEKTPDGLAIAIADGKPGSAVHVIGTGDIDLTEVRRDVLFVPELLPVHKLLRQFQTSRVHMAVVVDEYGATLGIVTMEDVVEEIVGDIDDEFDAASQSEFVRDGENFRVVGTYSLRELREKLQLLELPESDDVDTIGGYITAMLGRFPRANDSIELGPYTAKVIAVQQRRVAQVLISPRTQETMRADGPGAV
jgi:CBS domain containing-hemolysin-like protein